MVRLQRECPKVLLADSPPPVPRHLGFTPEEIAQVPVIRKMLRLARKPPARPNPVGRYVEAAMARQPQTYVPLPLALGTEEEEENVSLWHRIEETFIDASESVVTVLDNLNLLQRVVPALANNQVLEKIATHTNKVWVVALVLMLRKGLQELRAVWRRKEQLTAELRSWLQGKVEQGHTSIDPADQRVLDQYQNELGTLQHLRLTGGLEMAGNAIDLLLVVSELAGWELPGKAEAVMNIVSAAMSWWRISRVNSRREEGE